MTDKFKHTPGPWTWRNVSGAGLQISGTLPAGFNFSGIGREADGKTSIMTWTVRDELQVEIADARWVQFSTGSWDEMQTANARLIAAAPDMLAALKQCCDYLGSLPAGGTREPLYLAFHAADDAVTKATVAA